jgi:hypothetical protein
LGFENGNGIPKPSQGRQVREMSRWEGGDFVINVMINETEVETLKYSLLASVYMVGFCSTFGSIVYCTL